MGQQRIHLSVPDVGTAEERAVVRAVRSGWVAPAGPELDAFEREVARRAGVPYAVALSSGTAALHLGLRGLGVGPGQVVVVPTLTFAATAHAVVHAGAEPVFVDCDPVTGTLDPALLSAALTRLREGGRRVGAVVPVDLLGSCADYDRILPVCEAAGVPVLVDAAEALGAARGGRPAGSFGRAAVLSFNGNKIATTSGGGALVSADPELVAYCRYLATQAREPVPHYEHTEVGYNYRLSNVLAALGRAQLHRLDEFLARRRALRDRYAKLFAPVPGVRLLAGDDEEANCWLTAVVVDPDSAGWCAADLASFLAERDIETRPVWKPMHLQPVYASAPQFLTGAAERLFAHGLTLPGGSGPTAEEMSRVCAAVAAFLEARDRSHRLDRQYRLDPPERPVQQREGCS